MRTLVVRQNLENGSARTWRLRPGTSTITLGSSRLAKLSSMDPQSKGIEGVFECREGRWYWLNMNESALDQPAETEIQNENTVIRLAGSELSFQFLQKDQSLYERLEKTTAADPAIGTSTFDLEIVKFGGRVLSTKVLKSGAKESAQAKAARELAGDNVVVLRRPVHLGSDKDLTRMNPAKAMDAESRRGAVIVVLCSVLFAGIALYGPRSQKLEPIATLPPIPQKVTVAIAPMKVKKGSAVEKKLEKMPAPAVGEPKDAPGGRVAGMLRAVNSGRLSQLLGKVSAQAARSKQVIVGNGIKAGEGPSGAALAALGKVDRGGGDWNAAATGSGVTVSTSGRGGGRAVGGLGTLAAGNTGSGGVGLIEDESEISGGLDREIIAQTIKSYLGQILYCYERQLSANPDLFGKVAVRFTIGPTGSVESQNIGDTTLKNATVEGCILNKVASWRFPAPQGGTKVMVTYPFLFKSTN
ncbi:MAG: AgmX/PglI C-terminal domain-containing protein [Bdellovibrionaceae bacterium]|nr:AgmX/PglI C-terminal domain-containing protein [Pseudobdellovibrionaceae bacterium]